MRTGVIQRIASRLLWFAVVSTAVPMLVAIINREGRWWAWAVPVALAGLAALGFSRLPAAKAAREDSLRQREAFLIVVLGWLILVLYTALAYHLTGAFPGFADAWFESMSGYTTTGASVFTDIESLPTSVLFARSFSHWIGGMGIIVLSVAILPKLAVGGLQLFSAEATGIAADKLAPRIAATARRLWILYFSITTVLAVLLALDPAVSAFDSVNHSMATIATGGFSTKNASIGGFGSLYVEMLVLLFMFISGLSFTLQYRAFVKRKPSALARSPEFRLFAILTIVACLFVSLDLYADTNKSLGQSFRHGSFAVVSVITTTGFATDDFDQWPHFTRLMLVALMLVGGCAGSTAGGSKVVRLYVMVKYAGNQLRRLVRPRLVQTLFIGDSKVPRETAESIMGYYLLFFAAIFVGGLVLTALGMDFVSGTTASVSAMNSIGPGLGTVGAAQSFGHVPDAGKYVLSFSMLLGRLEIYTVLVLFTAHFWRRG